jgi:aspartyl protease family protein
MQDLDVGRLVFLSLWLVAMLGGFLVWHRQPVSRTLQQAAIWGVIFLGTIAIAGLWEDIARTVSPRQVLSADERRLELPRDADGHFRVTLEVNGTPVRFTVDTGATSVVLTREDAARAGIDVASLAFTGQASTANGVVAVAFVRLDSIGPFGDVGMIADVNGGEMEGSLLGMTYLSRFTSVEMRGNRMILQR